MRSPVLNAALYLCLLLCPCLVSCQKPKKAEVIVTNQEFAIERVSDYGFEITAKGEIQNIGEMDLKRIIVTGHCRSCGQSLLFGTWYISDIEKTADQQDVIKYLSIGEKAEFSFAGVAMYMTKTKEAPETMAGELEIEIVSFEPAP